MVKDCEQRSKIRINSSITQPFCELGMTSNRLRECEYFGLYCCWLFTSTLFLNYSGLVTVLEYKDLILNRFLECGCCESILVA